MGDSQRGGCAGDLPPRLTVLSWEDGVASESCMMVGGEDSQIAAPGSQSWQRRSKKALSGVCTPLRQGLGTSS
jgi:hypothetical protein